MLHLVTSVACQSQWPLTRKSLPILQDDRLDIKVIPSFEEVSKERADGMSTTMTALRLQVRETRVHAPQQQRREAKKGPTQQPEYVCID